MSEYVYFLRAVSGEGAIKIGSSSDVESRLRLYMMWANVPLDVILTIPGGIELERNIQNCFADCHSHCEWFHPEARLLAAIDAMKAGVPVNEAIDLTDIRGNVLGLTAKATRIRNGNPTSAEARRINSERTTA